MQEKALVLLEGENEAAPEGFPEASYWQKYPKAFFFFVQIQSSNELVVVVYVCEV